MNLNIRKLKGIDKLFEFDNNKSFINLGNKNTWVKFIITKSKLSINAGQRAIGLIPKQSKNINNLNERILYSYESKGDLIYFLKNNKKDFFLP